MKTLILLIERNSRWSPEVWMAQHGGKYIQPGQITIEDFPEWLSVVQDDHVLRDYDDDEREMLRGHLSDPVPHLIEWKGGKLVAKLLQAVPVECQAMIDNDHGVLSPIEAVRNLPLSSWITSETLL